MVLQKEQIWIIAFCYADSEDIPNPKNDVMDGMWLGVSLASQSQPGGRVLVSLLYNNDLSYVDLWKINAQKALLLPS